MVESAVIGYIGYDNKLHLYPEYQNRPDIMDMYLGTTGLTIKEALSKESLVEYNKPAQYGWSWSNFVKNIGEPFNQNKIEKYLIIGGIILITITLLKK